MQPYGVPRPSLLSVAAGWRLFLLCFGVCSFVVFLIAGHGIDFIQPWVSGSLTRLRLAHAPVDEASIVGALLLLGCIVWLSFIWKEPLWGSWRSLPESDRYAHEVLSRSVFYISLVTVAWFVCSMNSFFGSAVLVGTLTFGEALLVQNHLKHFGEGYGDAWTFVTGLLVMSGGVYLIGEILPWRYSQPLRTSPIAAHIIDLRMLASALLASTWITVTVVKAANRVLADRSFITSLRFTGWVQERTGHFSNAVLRTALEAAMSVATVFPWAVVCVARWSRRFGLELIAVITDLFVTKKVFIAALREYSRLAGLTILAWTTVWASDRLIEYCRIGHGIREWRLFIELLLLGTFAASGFCLVAFGALRRLSPSLLFTDYYLVRMMVIVGSMTLVGILTPLTFRYTEGFVFPGPLVVVVILGVIVTLIVDHRRASKLPAKEIAEPIRISDLARLIGSNKLVDDIRDEIGSVTSAVDEIDFYIAERIARKRGVRLVRRPEHAEKTSRRSAGNY